MVLNLLLEYCYYFAIRKDTRESYFFVEYLRTGSKPHIGLPFLANAKAISRAVTVCVCFISIIKQQSLNILSLLAYLKVTYVIYESPQNCSRLIIYRSCKTFHPTTSSEASNIGGSDSLDRIFGK